MSSTYDSTCAVSLYIFTCAKHFPGTICTTTNHGMQEGQAKAQSANGTRGQALPDMEPTSSNGADGLVSCLLDFLILSKLSSCLSAITIKCLRLPSRPKQVWLGSQTTAFCIRSMQTALACTSPQISMRFLPLPQHYIFYLYLML